MPERIQRRRTRGWRMPDGAVYVGRPTKWGNGYSPHTLLFRTGVLPGQTTRPASYAECVAAYERDLRCDDPDCAPEEHPWTIGLDVAELRGKDLVCWCPPGRACHADVLLDLANTTEAPDA